MIKKSTLLLLFFVGVCIAKANAQEAIDSTFVEIRKGVAPALAQHERQFDPPERARSVTLRRLEQIKDVLRMVPTDLLQGEFKQWVVSSIIEVQTSTGYGFDEADAKRLEDKYFISRAKQNLVGLTPEKVASLLVTRKQVVENNRKYSRLFMAFLIGQVTKADTVEIALDEGNPAIRDVAEAVLVWPSDFKGKIVVEKLDEDILNPVLLRFFIREVQTYQSIHDYAASNLLSLGYAPNSVMTQLKTFDEIEKDLAQAFEANFKPTATHLRFTSTSMQKFVANSFEGYRAGLIKFDYKYPTKAQGASVPILEMKLRGIVWAEDIKSFTSPVERNE